MNINSCNIKWIKEREDGHQQLLLKMNKGERRRASTIAGENEQRR
jgi:hypothetical protein